MAAAGRLAIDAEMKEVVNVATGKEAGYLSATIHARGSAGVDGFRQGSPEEAHNPSLL